MSAAEDPMSYRQTTSAACRANFWQQITFMIAIPADWGAEVPTTAFNWTTVAIARILNISQQVLL